MYFKLKGGATYVWFASDYLYDSGMYSSGSSREFCTGVRANDQPGPSILGGQFMRHYDVYFNREKNSISFILPKQNIIIGKSELDLTKIIIEILNKETQTIKLK